MTDRFQQTDPAAAGQAEPDPDPQLRAALKRVHGNHVAASDLRSRITALLESPPPPQEDDAGDAPAAPAVAGRIGPATRSRRTRPIAIAAAVLVAVGVTAIILHQRSEEDEYNRRNSYYVQQNSDVLKAMVATAIAPSTAAPADRVADVSDAKAVQSELSKRFSRQVPMPNLSSAGWQLKEAAAVAFRSETAARYDFARGDRRATVLSVPAKVFNDADDNDTYDATIDGHAISGYVAHDGVHCIIGDSGVPLAEITALRKQIQSL